jgi:hypothetical protein
VTDVAAGRTARFLAEVVLEEVGTQCVAAVLSHEIITAFCQRQFLKGRAQNLLSEVVIIGIDISGGCGISAGDQRNLCLLCLALLASLIGGLLLLHLLIAQSSESTSDLLDLVTWKVLCKLLCKLLHEENVVGFLRIVGENRDESVAELFKLELCLGVEEWEGSQVDSCCGVLGVYDNSVCSCGDLATVADTNAAE